MRKLALTALSFSVFIIVSAASAENNSKVVVSAPSNGSGDGANQAAKPFTQEQIDFIKNEIAKKDPTTTSATFYGLVQINANASDTQRSNVPDATPAHVRLGTKIKGGIASGQVEVELVGNQPSGSASKTDPNTGTSLTSTPPNDGIIIRQAQLNLDVINIVNSDNNYLTTVSFGGIRISGATYITPDITNDPSQYSRQDGVYVQEKASFGKTLIVNAGFGVFNTLFGMHPGNGAYNGWDNGVTLAQQSPWTSTSLNKSLAYVGTLSTTYNLDNARSFNASLYAGSQKNAPSTVNGDGTVVDTRDISHVEASLFYNDTKLLGSSGVISGNGVSLWYEREASARSQIAPSSSNGMVNDAEVAVLYGLGIGADSSPYLNGMLQKGDRLTYAASYNYVTNNFADTSAQSYTPVPQTTPPTAPIFYLNQNYKLYQIAASIGYAVSTFEVALNAEYTKSDRPLFSDKNGNTNTHPSEMKSYVTAAYVF